VPFRVRHRVWAVLLALLVLALVGGGIAWLATRTHHNAPKLAAPPPGRHLVEVPLCDHCAYDYNPDALSGPKTQNPGLDGLAVDGNHNTAWATEHYYTGKLGKAGVGLYVDAQRPVQARKMLIYTQSPGWSAQIWASNSLPDPDVFTTGPGGWVKLAQLPRVQGSQAIPLTVPATGYRYYLVWITQLPPGKMITYLNEVALYKLSS
jgi:eukaryotic-like serine/threonine-protein kinase